MSVIHFCLGLFFTVLVMGVQVPMGQQIRVSKLPNLRITQIPECLAAVKLPANFEKKGLDVKMNETMARHYTYTATTPNSQFSVQCGLSPWIIDDLDTLNFAYGFDGKNILRDSQDENTTISDTVVKGHPAKKYTSTRANGTIYMKSLLVIAGDQRYLITFGGYKKKEDSEPAGAVGQAMRDFFDSFNLTRITKPISLPLYESLPAGYLGERKSGKYVNKPFGFELDIPEEWIEISPAEFEKFLGSTGIDPTTHKRFAIPISYSLKRPYGQLPFGGLNIVIQKSIFRGSSTRATAENDRDNAVRNGAGTLGEDISEATLGGKKFFRYRFDKPIVDRIFKQVSYVTEINGFSIHFHLHYFDEPELRDLESFMKTIRFAK